MEIRFPKGFIWGAATASYQIEGSWNEDGRSPSIWDTFSKTPGKVLHGDTGDIAADHYHRWQEEIDLIKNLEIPAYRFSFAWPRIIPDGTGQINNKGLDFYDRLVDGLLDAGIKPFPTLFHWDLPQILEDKGGWPSRQTAYAFADYSAIVVDHFSDRINSWTTINEPWVISMLGYHSGVFAPGIKDLKAASYATHHLHLGHGLAVQAMRAAGKLPLQIGITLNLSHVEPAKNTPEDRHAADLHDVYQNRIFLDPLFYGKYPTEAETELGFTFPEGYEKDFSIITTPTEFLGINNYSRNVIKYDFNSEPFHYSHINPVGNSYSEMWEMAPQGMFDLLIRIKRDYPITSILITENGTAIADGVDADNRVRDSRRIQFLQDYISAVHQAIQSGVPVNGYFVWSLLDNFEWNLGYSRRFGIVFIDYLDGQKRIIKDSARWYRQVIKENGFKIKTFYTDSFSSV